MVKMEPPPQTNLLINTDPLELILLQNLDHPLELILLINKDLRNATFGPTHQQLYGPHPWK